MGPGAAAPPRCGAPYHSPDLQTCTPKHGEPLAPGFRHAYSTAPGHAASQAQGVQKKAHHQPPTVSLEPGMGTPTGTTAEGTETQLRRLRADHQNPGVTVPCSKTDTDGPGHRLLASSLRQSTVLHGRRTRQGTCPLTAGSATRPPRAPVPGSEPHSSGDRGEGRLSDSWGAGLGRALWAPAPTALAQKLPVRAAGGRETMQDRGCWLQDLLDWEHPLPRTPVPRVGLPSWCGSGDSNY